MEQKLYLVYVGPKKNHHYGPDGGKMLFWKGSRTSVSEPRIVRWFLDQARNDGDFFLNFECEYFEKYERIVSNSEVVTPKNCAELRDKIQQTVKITEV